MRTLFAFLRRLLVAARTPSTRSDEDAPALNSWSLIYTGIEVPAPPTLRELH